MLSHHVVAVRGDEAHGGHQIDSLEHDEGDGGGDGPGQQGQRLLVVEQVPQPDLVVHDHLMHSSCTRSHFESLKTFRIS